MDTFGVIGVQLFCEANASTQQDVRGTLDLRIVHVLGVLQLHMYHRSSAAAESTGVFSPPRGFPSLGHLKVLSLYLDFPLRCISLGHSGTERQRGERGSCSVALWLTEDHSGGS